MTSLPSPSAAAESVSPDAIAELRSLDETGPPLVLFELVQLFNESTPQLLSQACAALNDPTQLTLLAHTLKGSCSNFGAHRMEALCLELEQLGRDKRSASARDLVEALEQEYLKVRAALAEHCAALDR